MTYDGFFQNEGLDCHALLHYSDCEFTDKARMERYLREKKPRYACVFLIPYLTDGAPGNLSRYARARDYHLYFDALCSRAEKELPEFLMGLADRSPICERRLALKAGLGKRGTNGLILNGRYGSFCFIGVFLFSDLPRGAAVSKPREPENCISCGACIAACPTKCLSDPMKPCLSALTQAKRLTAEEEKLVAASPLVWGCDTCQEVCPVNKTAQKTPVDFFKENLIPSLDKETLDFLISSGEWDKRAYAWRGKEVLYRNLSLKNAQKVKE